MDGGGSPSIVTNIPNSCNQLSLRLASLQWRAVVVVAIQSRRCTRPDRPAAPYRSVGRSRDDGPLPLVQLALVSRAHPCHSNKGGHKRKTGNYPLLRRAHSFGHVAVRILLHCATSVEFVCESRQTLLVEMERATGRCFLVRCRLPPTSCTTLSNNSPDFRGQCGKASACWPAGAVQRRAMLMTTNFMIA